MPLLQPTSPSWEPCYGWDLFLEWQRFEILWQTHQIVFAASTRSTRSKLGDSNLSVCTAGRAPMEFSASSPSVLGTQPDLQGWSDRWRPPKSRNPSVHFDTGTGQTRANHTRGTHAHYSGRHSPLVNPPSTSQNSWPVIILFMSYPFRCGA